MNNNTGMPSPQKGSTGSWMTIIIVLIILCFGAWYFWGWGNSTASNSLNTVNSQSSSDAAASIEADLNTTDVNNPDYNLDADNFTSS
mgnify:CR=1 FL=1